MPVISRVLLAALVLLLPFGAASASPPVPAMPPLCDGAIHAAEDSFRLPPHLLQAIARVESGRPDAATGHLQPWPWTINAEGAGAFFPTKAAAIAAVQTLQARGVHSIDVGCMQVNLMFHPTAFASLDAAFDPTANTFYAARFLNALEVASHDWLTAVGNYHSQTVALGADYRRRVLALWHDPKASWQYGLAVAYRDFAPRLEVYGDFAPASSVYGAFAASANNALHR